MFNSNHLLKYELFNENISLDSYPILEMNGEIHQLN